MKPILRKLGRVAAVLCAFALVGKASAVDYKGTYATDLRISDGGKLNYSLTLDDDGDAKLVIKRLTEVDASRNNVRDWGDVLRYLEDEKSLEQTGEWRARRGSVEITFDRLYYGRRTEDIDATMEIDFEGNVGTVVDMSRDFYGRESKIVFRRGGGSNGAGLLTGLAVVAAGALVINSVSHGGGNAEFETDTRGYGTVYMSDGDRDRVDGVKLRLGRDGGFTALFRGSYSVEYTGRWTRGSRGYNFRVENVTIDGRRERASGSGSVSLDRDRRMTRLNFSAWLSDRRSSANVTFDPDRR